MSVSEAKTNGKEALKRMTVQEQAFRAYYASMTDAELLRIAANRSSFVDIAQKVLADELKKRNLAVPPGELSSAIMSQTLTPVGWAKRTLVSIKSALLSGPLRKRPSKWKGGCGWLLDFSLRWRFRPQGPDWSRDFEMIW
jgi:hypothetical protein